MGRILDQWDEAKRAAKAVPTGRVVELLGLEKAATKERKKYPCVKCASSDAMQLYADHAFCFSCWTVFDNIALAQHSWGMSYAETLPRLCGHLGIHFPEKGSGPVGRAPRARRPSTPTRVAREPQRAVYETDSSEEVLRQEIYGQIFHLSGLGDRSAAYLDGRGLNSELARSYGFRSINPLEWGDIREIMESLSEEHRRASGLYKEGQWSPPFGGRKELLLIPFFLSMDELAPRRIRFRNPSHDAGNAPRYQSLFGIGTPFPFNAQVLEGEVDRLYITEGELDAWALTLQGKAAVGLPGASTASSVGAWIAERVRDVAQIRISTDRDGDQGDKGEGAAQILVDALQYEHGPAWLDERVRREVWKRRDTGEWVKDAAEAYKIMQE